MMEVEKGLRYPETKGQYKVAYNTFVLHRSVDQSPSKFRSSRNSKVEATRELPITLWYPWKEKGVDLPNDEASADFHEEDLTLLFDESLVPLHLADGIWEKLKCIRTNSYKGNHPLLEGSWPLIIYSHGVGLNRSAGRIWCEELASTGFIVASIDHFGFVRGKDDIHDGSTVHIERSKVFSMPIMEIRNIYFQDISFFLDKVTLSTGMTTENNEEWTKMISAIDIDKIGIFGHSVGGGASWQLLWQDQRVKAAISMDGLLSNRVFRKVEGYLKKPLLIMYPMKETESVEFHPSELQPDDDTGTLLGLFQLASEDIPSWKFSKAKGYPDEYVINICIPDCAHFSFADTILINTFLQNREREEETLISEESSNKIELETESRDVEETVVDKKPPTIQEILGVGKESFDSHAFIKATRAIICNFFTSNFSKATITDSTRTHQQDSEKPVHPLTPPPSTLPHGFQYLTVHPSRLASLEKDLKDTNI